MDHNTHPSTSLSCELRIVRVKNIEIKPKGLMFVRCYLDAGNSARVRLESKEIPSKSSSITWNETFSLDCSGNQESIQWIKQGNLVFELRWRSAAAPFIGRIKGSRLIGRAEVPWQNIVDSTNMEVRKWILMTPENGRVHNDIIDSTALYIEIKLLVSRVGVTKERWNEGCGCIDGGCNSCVDYDFFAIEAALEAL